jgi:hypothetical protein
VLIEKTDAGKQHLKHSSEAVPAAPIPPHFATSCVGECSRFFTCGPECGAKNFHCYALCSHCWHLGGGLRTS